MVRIVTTRPIPRMACGSRVIRRRARCAKRARPRARSAGTERRIDVIAGTVAVRAGHGSRTEVPSPLVRARLVQELSAVGQRRWVDSAHVPVAQWTEQRSSKPWVAGSDPAGDATAVEPSAQVGALHLQLLWIVQRLVGVAPAPRLTGLDRACHRVAGRCEVRGCVTIRTLVAARHVAAG